MTGFSNYDHKMWAIVLVCLVFRISSGFGQNIPQTEKEIVSSGVQKTDFNDTTELKVESFLDEMVDWASSAAEYMREKSRMQMTMLQPSEHGRRLKHKKAELKFIMKTLLILKVVLGLILPLGIISSKILSWKAVTLSLMAFMLAKILFVKNLLTGKNAFSVSPANFVPPVFIQGGANDVFWKRQGDSQNVYPWSST